MRKTSKIVDQLVDVNLGAHESTFNLQSLHSENDLVISYSGSIGGPIHVPQSNEIKVSEPNTNRDMPKKKS